MLTLTRDQVREVDRLAIEVLGMPGVVLMENAGRAVSDMTLDLLEGELHLVAQDANVVILCGGGNNGGDGYVIARHLSNAGVNVTAVAIKDAADLRGDAAVNWAIADRMGRVAPAPSIQDLHERLTGPNGPHVIVDALLGTGFQGDVRDDLAQVIQVCIAAHEAGVKVVAVDVPSGLDCDTGQPSNATIIADMTVTFVAAKVGFTQSAAEPYVGQIIPVEIGTPPSLIGRVLSA